MTQQLPLPYPPVAPAEKLHGDYPDLPPLYAITVVSNPIRFNSRYQLYKEFEHRLSNAGAIPYTVELGFGDRPFAVTDADNPRHVRLRTSQELWHKENLINIGVSRLPDDWKYVAWIDADIGFTNPNWANETVQQLQHYRVVQMFTHAIDLGPDQQPIEGHTGFVYALEQNGGVPPKNVTSAGGGYYGKTQRKGLLEMRGSPMHPGYAWAMRRSTFEQMGGLMDRAVLGSADHHMACAMYNLVHMGFFAGMTKMYRKMLMDWQSRADKYIDRNIGYVNTSIVHYWHGKKNDRGYLNRKQLLAKHAFDPFTDLVYDSRGVLRLTGNKRELRNDLQRYMRSRNEDSIDM